MVAVVHQHIDSAKVIVDALDKRRRRIRVGDIEPLPPRLAPHLLHFRSNGLEHGLRARRQRHARSFSGEREGNRPTEAGANTGNDCHLSR